MLESLLPKKDGKFSKETLDDRKKITSGIWSLIQKLSTNEEEFKKVLEAT